MDTGSKEVRWIGSSRDDVRNFPKAVRQDIGQALFAAQIGREHSTVKALHGFSGRSVLEIVSDYNTGTWRTIYTVFFTRSRKSRRKASPRRQKELDLVERRLKVAIRDYEERQKDDSKKNH